LLSNYARFTTTTLFGSKKITWLFDGSKSDLKVFSVIVVNDVIDVNDVIEEEAFLLRNSFVKSWRILLELKEDFFYNLKNHLGASGLIYFALKLLIISLPYPTKAISFSDNKSNLQIIVPP